MSSSERISSIEAGTWIESVVRRFIRESPENTLRDAGNEKAWADPIVGFSSGADPLYLFYKRDIGEFYLTPAEIFGKTYPHADFEPDELTVISWILPHTEATKVEHRGQIRYPNERWARARIYGEEVNDKLRRHVVETLMVAGVRAVAPVLSPLFRTTRSEKYENASTWSERHTAYASGLGTFGLCDGLITPVGKAMRCGSAIARVKIKPPERLYKSHREYCLYFSKGICGLCIGRCPAGAISANGHDKRKCSPYVDMTRDYVMKTYGFDGYGCGLCQTGVPCESKIPDEADLT